MKNMIVTSLWTLSLLSACSQNKKSSHDDAIIEKLRNNDDRSSINRPLPTPNKKPISQSSFCQGLENKLKVIKQNINEEASFLCNGGVPTDLLNALIANPHQGGRVNLSYLPVAIRQNRDFVQNTVAYSMRIRKSVVPALLGDEAIIKKTSYSNGSDFGIRLAINSQPPQNDGDSDTAFRIEQLSSSSNNRVRFNDRSYHELKFYRLFENNYDFLLSGRTLVSESDQVKRSTIVRGVMTDPQNSEYSISFTVVNSIMNGRGYPDEVGERFTNFILWDVESSFDYHTYN